MALKNEQLKRTPTVEVLPHVDAFATHCHLDPGITRELIQNGKWGRIIKNLVRSHQSNQAPGN
jgi:hypothetical protein